jgi:hypothetical protein
MRAIAIRTGVSGTVQIEALVMGPTTERRAEPRAPLEGRAVVFVGSRQASARTLDISVSGISVSTPTLETPAQFIRVNFSIGPESGWFDADGVLARVAEDHGGYLWGVKFLSMAPEVARKIRGYVARSSVRRVEASAPPPPSAVRAPHPPAGPAKAVRPRVDRDLQELFAQAVREVGGASADPKKRRP